MISLIFIFIFNLVIFNLSKITYVYSLFHKNPIFLSNIAFLIDASLKYIAFHIIYFLFALKSFIYLLNFSFPLLIYSMVLILLIL